MSGAERRLVDLSFRIGRIERIASTGTYGDSPFHRYADGEDLSGLPGQGFRFHALPVKVKGFGTFLVRAFAVVSGL